MEKYVLKHFFIYTQIVLCSICHFFIGVFNSYNCCCAAYNIYLFDSYLHCYKIDISKVLSIITDQLYGF